MSAGVLVAAGAVTTTLALGAALLTAPAADAAPVTPSAIGYSSSAATGSGTMSASLSLTGAVGGLLDGLISPIVNNALDPLVGALQGSVNSLVGAALGASSSYSASSPSVQGTTSPAAFPGDLPGGLPNPCTASSATLPCYKAATTTIGASPLAGVSVGSLSGYTEQVTAGSDAKNPIFGRAQVASPSIAVLPAISTLADPATVRASLVDSKASCPNAGSTSPTASVSATSVSLLGGRITLGVLNGAVTSLVVNGTSYGTLAALPVVNLGAVVVQPYGQSLRVDIPLTLAQLVQGLALPASAVTELLADVTAASFTLSLIVGPSTATTATTAKAWGLGISADLSGSASFTLLGLVGATVSLPTGIGAGNYGNLLDLRLGYSACQSGSGTTPSTTPAVPPALV